VASSDYRIFHPFAPLKFANSRVEKSSRAAREPKLSPNIDSAQVSGVPVRKLIYFDEDQGPKYQPVTSVPDKASRNVGTAASACPRSEAPLPMPTQIVRERLGTLNAYSSVGRWATRNFQSQLSQNGSQGIQ
jgi:hypothetical protein